MVEQAFAVSQPVRAGGDDHVIGLDIEYLVRTHAVVEIDLDIRHFLNLLYPIIAHPRPFAEARQCGLARDASTEPLICLGQQHLVATLAECTRGFEPGGSRTDHQHG